MTKSNLTYTEDEKQKQIIARSYGVAIGVAYKVAHRESLWWEGRVAITARKYSVTTSKHTSKAYGKLRQWALSCYPCYYWEATEQAIEYLAQYADNPTFPVAIKDLQGEDYALITDSSEVRYILDNCGLKKSDYVALVVSVSEGDYREIWAVCGNSLKIENTRAVLLLHTTKRE